LLFYYESFTLPAKELAVAHLPPRGGRYQRRYQVRSRNVGLSILFISEFEERGVRKIEISIERLFLTAVTSK